jgi:hypothetical protein
MPAPTRSKQQSLPVAQNQNAEEQLSAFMKRYLPEIASLAKAARAEMRKHYPTAIELVYDNYNALAIGYGPSERASEAIFSIALYPRWVSLFFLQGARLSDPDQILKGSGSVAKHIVLSSSESLNDPAVRALMHEALMQAKVPFDSHSNHRLIIKSISAKQRPRRPGPESKTAIRPTISQNTKRSLRQAES